MSLTPESPLPPEIPLSAAPPPLPERPPRSWQSKLLTVCFAIFTFEVGLFLIIFPWMDNWNLNYFSGMLPSLPDFWDQPAFRGALSGLGLVNLYIALRQAVGLLRG
jgi:hypothetical protein